jgi:histidinol dehydrogenase
VKIIDTAERSFEEEFRRLRMRKADSGASVEETVRGILEDVRENGDEALFRYTERFDGVRLSRDTVEVSRGEIERAVRDLDGDVLKILETAAERIERFHRNQILHSWRMEEEDGAVMGQEIVPLGRVGVYAPGGLAPYPSTVLMGAVPARVAGVREIFLATPAKQGGVSPLLLAAAHVAGVTRCSGWEGPRPWRPSPTVRNRCPRWTRSSGRGTSTWRRRKGWSSGTWGST